MKKFLIKVNGNQYEVEVEEIKEGQTTAAFTEEVQYTPPVKQAEKRPEPETKAKPEPAPAKTAAAVPEGAETVKAPIPGTVLKIEVKTATRLRRAMFSFYLRQ